MNNLTIIDEDCTVDFIDYDYSKNEEVEFLDIKDEDREIVWVERDEYKGLSDYDIVGLYYKSLFDDVMIELYNEVDRVVVGWCDVDGVIVNVYE